MTRALVISGGGAKGAFAVGVLKYLFEHEQPDYQLMAGTSTGALILPLAAVGDIAGLERVYTTSNTSDILLRGNVIHRIMTKSSLFDVSPLIELTRQRVQPIHQQIMNSGKLLFFSAICLQTGRITYFSTRAAQGGAQFDVEVIRSLDEMVNAIIASADQPVFMPPVEVFAGRQPLRQYVDGGVREYAPIAGVIANGATHIDVILHSPKKIAVNEKKYNSVIDILFRTIDLFSTDVGVNDIDNARLVAAEKGIELRVFQPERELAATDGLTFNPNEMLAMLHEGERIASLA
jgi:predicted acylesterase/phospholipase RssA